jgi:type III pantothenate kinase
MNGFGSPPVTNFNPMLLLLDIGNTHTHLGLANAQRIVKQRNLPTISWFQGAASGLLADFIGNDSISRATLCSVVPKATSPAKNIIKTRWRIEPLELTSDNISGVEIDYPEPATIGADRLANAVAVRFRYGAPAVVVDFGTAVTFDVVNAEGKYAGGIIAPGLAVMTDYLHEKTALLPKIEIREINSVIGKNTEEAMIIGAVHGYRGLVRELVRSLQKELRADSLPVVATGGYAQLIASKLPEITAVEPLLTLEGLRLISAARP